MNPQIQKIAIKKLDTYVACVLKIGYWTGEKKVPLSDTGAKTKVPDSVLRGIVKLSDGVGARIKGLAALDRQARYYLDSMSISFGPLKLVKDSLLDSVNIILDGFKVRFTALGEEAAERYLDTRRQTIQQYPDLLPAISRHFPQSIRDKFSFQWNWLRIAPEQVEDKNDLAQALADNSIESLQAVINWLDKIKNVKEGDSLKRTFDTLRRAVDKAEANLLIPSTGLEFVKSMTSIGPGYKMSGVAKRKLLFDISLLKGGGGLDLQAETEAVETVEIEDLPVDDKLESPERVPGSRKLDMEG